MVRALDCQIRLNIVLRLLTFNVELVQTTYWNGYDPEYQSNHRIDKGLNDPKFQVIAVIMHILHIAMVHGENWNCEHSLESFQIQQDIMRIYS